MASWASEVGGVGEQTATGVTQRLLESGVVRPPTTNAKVGLRTCAAVRQSISMYLTTERDDQGDERVLEKVVVEGN